MNVSWEELGKELVTLPGNEKIGEDPPSVHVLELILGAEFFVQAVEHAVSSNPGCELARSLVLDLKPGIAIKRCYEIFRNTGLRPSLFFSPYQSKAYYLLIDIFSCMVDLPPDPDPDPDPEYDADILDPSWLDIMEQSRMPMILEIASIHHPSDYMRKQSARLLSEDKETLDRERAGRLDFIDSIRDILIRNK